MALKRERVVAAIIEAIKEVVQPAAEPTEGTLLDEDYLNPLKTMGVMMAVEQELGINTPDDSEDFVLGKTIGQLADDILALFP